jgi:hypothetical protein
MGARIPLFNEYKVILCLSKVESVSTESLYRLYKPVLVELRYDTKDSALG